jgi:hypothetical protein
MTARLRTLWGGDVPLNEAFWSYAVWYGVLLNFTVSVLFMFLLAADAGAPLLLPVFLLPIPYNVFVIVAVWRSADRYPGPRKWADLARFGTVIWMIALTAA